MDLRFLLTEMRNVALIIRLLSISIYSMLICSELGSGATDPGSNRFLQLTVIFWWVLLPAGMVLGPRLVLDGRQRNIYT
jgi:hypothetical protein